tara:strand:+ start:1292 stop:2047 length:756 start_codon:yes stop_codon:yes gene_type:complete
MDSKVATFRASLLFVLCALVDCLVLLAIGLLAGIDLAFLVPCSVVVASIWILCVYWKIDSFILRKIHAKSVKQHEHPRFLNLVEGVCISYGFRKPELFIVEDVAPNMMMVGRGPQRSNLVVTTGLLDRVERTELEGLITHELARSRSRTSYLEGALAILVAWPWSFLPGVVSKISDKLMDPWSIAEIDVAAVGLTRYPPGLGKALESLYSDGREPTHNPRFCRHMWINPPSEPLISSGFTTDDRIVALAEL